MTETHDTYVSDRPLSTSYIEVHRYETGPGMAEDGDPGSIRVNYVFVRHSSGTAPSPLPLFIPHVLLEGPSADLRPILMKKLEAEGVVLGLGDIRFWQAREPLNVSHVFNDPNVWIQKEGVETKKFEAIPFTESLISSLGERVQNTKLLHIIVTGGDAPAILESATPDLSTMAIPASQAIAMGRFHVLYHTLERKTWEDVREGERHSQDISIPWPAASSPESLQIIVAQTPTIILGICHLDTVSHGDDIQILSSVSNAHQDGFRIHFDSFGRTFLYYGFLSWMAITPSHPAAGGAIQCGAADSQSTLSPRKLGRRYTRQRVLFRKPYERAPCVFSCLAGLNIGGSGSRHCDIRTFVTSVDREGFSLHIEKTRDSEVDVNQVVAHAQTSWVAFPSGGTADRKMACGEFHLGDGERTEENAGQAFVRWRGRSVFTETFASPPQVFAAFTSFDVDRSTTVRLALDIEKVTREGIEWQARTWLGTIVYSATFAYLAVGAP